MQLQSKAFEAFALSPEQLATIGAEITAAQAKQGTNSRHQAADGACRRPDQVAKQNAKNSCADCNTSDACAEVSRQSLALTCPNLHQPNSCLAADAAGRLSLWHSTEVLARCLLMGRVAMQSDRKDQLTVLKADIFRAVADIYAAQSQQKPASHINKGALRASNAMQTTQCCKDRATPCPYLPASLTSTLVTAPSANVSQAAQQTCAGQVFARPDARSHSALPCPGNKQRSPGVHAAAGQLKRKRSKSQRRTHHQTGLACSKGTGEREVWLASLRQLVGMGYAERLAQDALDECCGDLDCAVDFLLSSCT